MIPGIIQWFTKTTVQNLRLWDNPETPVPTERLHQVHLGLAPHHEQA